MDRSCRVIRGLRLGADQLGRTMAESPAPGAAATASLGSTIRVPSTCRSYSSVGIAPNRGCPWLTAADRCLGHVGGTSEMCRMEANACFRGYVLYG